MSLPQTSGDAVDAGPCTLAEVSHLWWFADGAIMDPGTRAHLHRSWGLCARHAWLYFRVETELRINPLGNAVLFADLIDQAVRELRGHRSTHHKVRRLGVRETCFTCDYTAQSSGKRRFDAELVAVNTGVRTREWCVAAQPVWQPRVCRECVAQTDPVTAVPCRLHTVGPDYPVDYLADLARRVERCQRSMTVDGPPRGPDTDAALVEAIGWCAGWHPALAMRQWPADIDR